MYETILVPLDGSRRAERILAHVEELAQHFKSTIILLRVVEPDPEGFGMQGSPVETYIESLDRATNEAQSYLVSVAGEFRAKGINACIIVERGRLANTITGIASREEVDLVAMASHGRTGLGRVFYGSVTAGVLQRIDRPLLLVRADE